jgi:hypothetical protein
LPKKRPGRGVPVQPRAKLPRRTLDAQARAGIAPEDRAPIYSGEVETYLVPIVAKIARGDAPGVMAWPTRICADSTGIRARLFSR